MADNVDLNRLRDTLLNQQRGTAAGGKSDRVFVGPDGRLRLGGSDEAAARTNSEVPSGVFAADGQ